MALKGLINLEKSNGNNQAREGSSRLPSKVILPLGTSTSLKNVMMPVLV